MRRRIHITGVVQGVGFRPFVYNLANRLDLKGFCLNDSDGVLIEVEGAAVEEFISRLRTKPPPLSKISNLTVNPIVDGTALKDFVIKESISMDVKLALISPDISTCQDCLQELFNPADRRYLYPFINCTNCGPRYSITMDIPYDRPMTTMAQFPMCHYCMKEYRDPLDRRFHAQPNCCAECGPRVWLAGNGGTDPVDKETNHGAIKAAQRLLEEGAILAVKGLGGFHLACDAFNQKSVKRLRSLKRSAMQKSGAAASNKPFAVMAPNVDMVKTFAKVPEDARGVLESRAGPIVLLEKIGANGISEAVAPNNKRFGVMLPYTPLHYLLINSGSNRTAPLVMTSGNRSEEPIVTSNKEAVERLSGIADFFLLHDRDIYMRVDDSIVRVQRGKTRVLRRARGFTPQVIDLGTEMSEILACGPSLKNTFCLTKGSNAILSTHIGDLENHETLIFFEETLANLKKTFGSSPEIIAHDLHPDYLSTWFSLEYAKEHGIPEKNIFGVQHHHAHIVSCMAEHGIHKDVIGVSFDGTGLGTDGNIWGGEFFIANRKRFARKAHLKYLAMPGGEKAITEPWRMSLSYIHDAYGLNAAGVVDKIFKRLDPKKTKTIAKMIHSGLNTPLTSSVGRLFDAVSSILGIRDSITFEAEAAMELESVADTSSVESRRPYPFHIINGDPVRIDLGRLTKGIIDDLGDGVKVSVISSRFHHTVGEVIVTVAKILRGLSGIEDVVLSGGVFQNALLLDIASKRLSEAGFKTLYNEMVPTNDGGVSLGQAVVAWEKIKERTTK